MFSPRRIPVANAMRYIYPENYFFIQLLEQWFLLVKINFRVVYSGR
jgi:hypothetical protein